MVISGNPIGWLTPYDVEMCPTTRASRGTFPRLCTLSAHRRERRSSAEGLVHNLECQISFRLKLWLGSFCERQPRLRGSVSALDMEYGVRTLTELETLPDCSVTYRPYQVQSTSYCNEALSCSTPAGIVYRAAKVAVSL